MKQQMLFIRNPVAGKQHVKDDLFAVLDVFAQAGYCIWVRDTTAAGAASAYVRQYAAQVSVVICCGGDGTLNETVAGLMSLVDPTVPKPMLGYLPHGTTNDFAASLGISQDVLLASKQMLQQPPRAIDIGQWNNRNFVYVASFGAFTKTAYGASQTMKNMFGYVAYLLEGIKDIASLHGYQMKLLADGKCLDGTYLFGAVCNATSIGGLVHLDAQDVCLDDGLFELLLIPMPKTIGALQTLARLLAAGQYDSDAFVFCHVSTVQIKTDEELPWSLDGEYAQSVPAIEICNVQKAIKILA